MEGGSYFFGGSFSGTSLSFVGHQNLFFRSKRVDCGGFYCV